MVFSQTHLGRGSLSPWLALMSLQNNYGLSAIPGLVPLGTARGAPYGMLRLQYGLLSREGPWCSVAPCQDKGPCSALSLGYSP